MLLCTVFLDLDTLVTVLFLAAEEVAPCVVTSVVARKIMVIKIILCNLIIISSIYFIYSKMLPSKTNYSIGEQII